ncbi:hypothetical protein BJV82DRAFT_585791 [Fennellomyces sp. T-0311]|nr:hypothetical protein BJV82DRAFT_585791 [Fennellomyces sp. T-0311]
MHWTRINLSMSVGPGARYGHSAVFPDNSTKMFIIFGADRYHYSHSDFRVLDTASWEWVNDYEGSNIDRPSGLSKALIVGIIAAVTIGITILVGILTFIRKQLLYHKRTDAPTESD